MSTQPPSDDWPLLEERVAWATRADEPTVVDADMRRRLPGPAPVAPGPPPPPGPWYDNRLAIGLSAVLLVVAAAAIAALAFKLHQSGSHGKTAARAAPARTAIPTKARMPLLVGLDKQQALMRLRRAGLSATILERATNRPTGTIIKQRPAQAAVISKSTPVTLVVDTGAPRPTVPSLVGKQIDQAQATLQAAELKSQTTSVASTQPEGTIVRQSPAAGSRLETGGLVRLSVARPATAKQQSTTATTTTSASITTSTANAATTPTAPQPQTVTIPDVTGQSENDAAHAFMRVGILASLAFYPSDDPLGTVVQQARPGGTAVPNLSHVQINISSGRNQPESEPVPRVIGSSLQQAVTRLNDAHLRLIYVKLPVTRDRAGKIVQQSPLPGSRAPENAQVLVFLGAYRR